MTHTRCSRRPRARGLLRAFPIALTLVIAGLHALGGRAAAEPLRVVTTTEDLAAIAREVGGDLVEVTPIAHGYQDPHFVDAKPSFLVKLSKADIFVQVGRELEVGWAPALLTGARNSRILPGARGFVDASANIDVIEKPDAVSRAAGDVHPLGNPHTWLDPANGGRIAETLRDAFSAARPSDHDLFASRCADFQARLATKIEAWRAQAAAIGLRGAAVVTYHRSWSYFARAFGCEVIDFVEPRPGVPPTPAHIQALEEAMRARAVRLLIVEPYFDCKLPAKIASETGVPMVVLPPSVGASPEIATYFDLFDRQLALLAEALRGHAGS